MLRCCHWSLSFVVLVSVLLVAWSCGRETETCIAADDCDARARCVQGKCTQEDAPGEEGEGEAEIPSEGEGEPTGEGEGEGELPGEGEGEPSGCRDDGDDSLSARELPLVLDTPLRMLEAVDDDEDLLVDVVGREEDGERFWDFSAPYENDAAIVVQAQTIDARHWFAEDVEDLGIVVADEEVLYAAQLDEKTWGIFLRTSQAGLLHAVASVEPQETFLSYSPPILALQYPLDDGAAYSSTSAASGTFLGNPFYCSTDTYESTVSGHGVARTAASEFPVLRILTRQSVVVDNCFGLPLAVVERRQVVLVSACTGAVVQVTASEGATDFAFTTAARVRRVGLPP
jgi:hypothetical protein